jgi:hypothetical protein
MVGGGLLAGVDVSEYVGETLACIEEEITNHDLAESIADTLCAQGRIPAARFELLVEELEAAIPYYR